MKQQKPKKQVISKKIFEKNLELFQLKNPRAAFLFVLENPEEKSVLPESSFEDIDGPTAVTVVYGAGSSYAAYKKWLHKDPNNTLIIVDDDLASIHSFLGQEAATKLLEDRQAHFYFYEGPKPCGVDDRGNEIIHGRETLQELAWGTFPNPFSVVAAPLLPQNKLDTFDAFKKALSFEADEIHSTLDEYVMWGAAYFKNFWPNLQFLPESFRGNKLAHKFKGVPAIIVGAGPSLNQHIDQLKSLTDKALIFAGGSAMTACTNAGLQPHFGGIIDPNPTQLKRLQESKNTDSPYFFRGRACYEALKLVKGHKLYITGGDGYYISEWFEKKLKFFSRVLGGGHNISNLLIEIAAKMGCNPIILVGFDLSYTGGDAYAKGVTHEKQEPTETPVEWIDIHGKPIMTHWKWLHEALWITDFHKKHKRLKIINATEGGIAIKEIKNKPLHELAEMYMKSPLDLKNRVEKEIQAAGRLPCTPEGIERAKSKMKKSLEEVAKSLMKVTALLHQQKPETDSEVVLLLQEIRKEIAYQYVLEVFERMRIKLEYYKRRFFVHPTMTEKAIAAFDQALLVLRYAFLLRVVYVNFQLMDREDIKPPAMPESTPKS